MQALLKLRLASDESGFTLIELLIVLIILGILMTIAIPGYLTFKDRAQKAAAKGNVHSAVAGAIAYGSDNVGSVADVDANAGTTGYAGMTLPLMQTFDHGVKNIRVFSASTSTYCIDSTVGFSVYKQAGPAADIVSGSCP